MPASSRGTVVSVKPLDPQSPSPACDNAAGALTAFATPVLDKSLASGSASREDNTVPENSIPESASASRDKNAVPENTVPNIGYEDEDGSAGTESSDEPKSSTTYHSSSTNRFGMLTPLLDKKKRPPRRRRPRRHGAASQHSNDAGDTSMAEIPPQDNAAPVHSTSPKGISAPEEVSPAEKQIEEPVSPNSAKKDIDNPSSFPNPPQSSAPPLPSSLDLAEFPEASVAQSVSLDAMSKPARAPENSTLQRDSDLESLRQKMSAQGEEFEKKLSAQKAGFEALLKTTIQTTIQATMQTTINGLTREFDRKFELQTKSFEDRVREKDAKNSLQETEIEALKSRLRLLEEAQSTADQGSSAADDENQVGDIITEAAQETEDDEFFEAEEGTPEPAPLNANVAPITPAQEPETIHLQPGSKSAIWQRVQPKLRWLLVGTFVTLAIIAAFKAFISYSSHNNNNNEELPIPALPSFDTKEARLYLERLFQQGIGRREIAKIAPYLKDLEEILTSIPTRTYNSPTRTYDLGLVDSF